MTCDYVTFSNYQFSIMEIILTRIAKRQQYTIGRLAIVERIDDAYLAGEREVYFCWLRCCVRP